jgi:hypothetical protein
MSAAGDQSPGAAADNHANNPENVGGVEPVAQQQPPTHPAPVSAAPAASDPMVEEDQSEVTFVNRLLSVSPSRARALLARFISSVSSALPQIMPSGQIPLPTGQAQNAPTGNIENQNPNAQAVINDEPTGMQDARSREVSEGSEAAQQQAAAGPSTSQPASSLRPSFVERLRRLEKERLERLAAITQPSQNPDVPAGSGDGLRQAPPAIANIAQANAGMRTQTTAQVSSGLAIPQILQSTHGITARQTGSASEQRVVPGQLLSANNHQQQLAPSATARDASANIPSNSERQPMTDTVANTAMQAVSRDPRPPQTNANMQQQLGFPEQPPMNFGGAGPSFSQPQFQQQQAMFMGQAGMSAAPCQMQQQIPPINDRNFRPMGPIPEYRAPSHGPIMQQQPQQQVPDPRPHTTEWAEMRGRLNSQGHMLHNIDTQMNTLGTIANHQSREIYNLNMGLQQVNQPASYARHLPRPPSLIGDWGVDSKTIPDSIVWFNKVVEYMQLTGMNQVTNFKFFLQGNASKWFDSLGRYYLYQGLVLDGESLAAEFLRAFGDPARQHHPIEARERLERGEVTQKPGMSVAEYVQKFITILLDAPDMSETEKIFWFFKHLQPGLGKAAAVDKNNQRHASLASAVDAAYAAEHAMKVAKQSRANFASATAAVASVPEPISTYESEEETDISADEQDHSDGEQGEDAHLAFARTHKHQQRNPSKYGKGASRAHEFSKKKHDKYQPRHAHRKQQVLAELRKMQESNNSRKRGATAPAEGIDPAIFEFAKKTHKCAQCLNEGVSIKDAPHYRGCKQHPFQQGPHQGKK